MYIQVCCSVLQRVAACCSVMQHVLCITAYIFTSTPPPFVWHMRNILKWRWVGPWLPPRASERRYTLSCGFAHDPIGIVDASCDRCHQPRRARGGACIYWYTSIYRYTCTYICVHIHEYLQIYMYVYIHIYTRVYTYIYIL